MRLEIYNEQTLKPSKEVYNSGLKVLDEPKIENHAMCVVEENNSIVKQDRQ